MPTPRPHLLLLLPRGSYRARAFLEAARGLGAAVTVGSDHRALLGREVVSLEGTPLDSILTSARARASEPFTAILGTDERTAGLAAAASAILDLPHNPADAVAAAHDKLAFRRALAAAKLPGPAFAEVPYGEDPNLDGLPYPCVLKPRGLSASQGVIRADDPRQARAALRRISQIDRSGTSALAESYLPGAEVALEGLLRAGRLHVIALFDKPDAPTGPFFEETIYVTPSRLRPIWQSWCRDAVQAAVTALGLTRGPLHAELRVDGTGARLIELATRSIGGSCADVLRFADGSTLERIVVADALGLPLPTLEREAAGAGVMMLPIPRLGILRSIRGLDAARAVPDIVDVVISVPAGATIVPPPEGGSYLGFVFARAAASGAAEAALRAAHAALSFEIGDEPAAATGEARGLGRRRRPAR